MPHLLVIAVFLVLFLRDALPARSAASPGAWSWAAPLVSPVLIALVAGVLLRRAARALQATGDTRHVARGDRVLRVSLWAGVLVHAVSVLALGWLDFVRSSVGDLIVIDELLASLPPLVLMPVLWFFHAPIDALLRDAVLLRRLDEGGTIYPRVSRLEHVAMNLRHQVAIVLVPLAGVLAWGELVERLARAAVAQAPPPGSPVHGLVALIGSWLVEARAGAWIVAGVQLAGGLMLFALIPLALRRIWDTVPLAAGPLRDRLLGVCTDHAVRVRDLLVWRTSGTMVNGAVMGFHARARFILFTDALLDLLHQDHLEAVTAHEVAHIRLRHLAWLVVSVMASALATALVVSVVVQRAWAGLVPEELLGLVALVPSAAAALLGFGYVSRRFEWQADAFAAAHLSRRLGPDGGGRIAPEAVAAMSGALCLVADAAGVPSDRFTWRHGSIAHRRERLDALVGERADRLPIHREVRTLKLAAAIVLVVAVAGLVLGGFA